MPDQIPDDVRGDRIERLVERIQHHAAARNAALVGTVQQVLVDAIDGELAIARSRADAPEIDGLVQVQDGAERGLKPGQFAQVRIMGSDEHDLYGVVA
jgi:ribosomal protein S12 methylthiotransferase